VIVPPGVEANIPVKLTWSSYRMPKADWLMEPKKLKSGVFVSHTVPGDQYSAAVDVVNTSSYVGPSNSPVRRGGRTKPTGSHRFKPAGPEPV